MPELIRERPSLTIILPCLNEHETISICVKDSLEVLRKEGLTGEVLVVDNGSTDGSQDLALQAGARVIHCSSRGYGSAIRCGIEATSTIYAAMADSDGSYDIKGLGPFIRELQNGFDLVMGNRFAGGIEKGAMPWLHRYVGNPLLSLIGRTLFKLNIGDFHCGIRAFRVNKIRELHLLSTGMEFASEMLIKSSTNGLRISEVPTCLSKDGRIESDRHLRTFRDGWRHLRLMLLCSPTWLYVYPGIVVSFLGLILSGVLFLGPVTIGSANFDIATLLLSNLLVVLGLQAVIYGAQGQLHYQWSASYPTSKITRVARVLLNLELILALSLLLVGIGIASVFMTVNFWIDQGLGEIDPSHSIRLTSISVLTISVGFQLAFGALFLATLKSSLKN